MDSFLDKIISAMNGSDRSSISSIPDNTNRALEDFIRGGSSGSDFSSVYQSLLRWRFSIAMDSPDEFHHVLQMSSPGQMSVYDGSVGHFLNAPMSSDVWYFSRAITIIPYYSHSDSSYNDSISDSLLEFISPFLEYYGSIKPLKSPFSAGDITSFSNNGRYVVKELRYENRSPLNGFEHPSYPTPDSEDGSKIVQYNNISAYLAVPFGPLGAMQTISIVVESPHESLLSSSDWHPQSEVLSGVNSSDYGGLIPHKCDSSDNSLVGIHIVESLYNFKVSKLSEYPAPPFEGHVDLGCHQWFRYYIPSSAVWPVPGTFVGVLCKSAPTHCWWYQDTNPFLYSGNWFETEYYTTGIVKSVIDDDDEITPIYCVLVRGYLLHLRSSDFLEYAVGDRVAILKKFSPSNASFTWSDLDDIRQWLIDNEGIGTAKGYAIHPSYVVVPISFYEKV